MLLDIKVELPKRQIDMSLELRKKTWVEWTRHRQNFLTSYFEIISDLQKLAKIIYQVPVYTSPNVNICVTRVDL